MRTSSQPQPLVLITGVSREEGIGFGLAQALLAQGFEVIITARDLAKAEELAGKLATGSRQATAQAADITNDASVQQLADFIQQRFGRLDVLINNAGSGFDYGITPLHTDLVAAQAAFETNLFGTWRLIKALHPLPQRGRHPRIVNISSGAGSFSHPIFGLPVHPALMTSYGLSKLALNGLTVQLARELKPEGILVNAVNPGFVATAPGMADMGARPVADSVAGIIWAATLPDDGPTGRFFEDKQEIGW
ncbi:SDR family NAD(P)-dependent oxidoreductase [Hymenobacter weizhouensis]|uniref:SDR family NAD(P)-dependent oxidoreductase n=1 Tax=Hymenobacter sp. YIM 151500-1 TaxID=2987689 RepID=UPI002226E42F|nr:SDR family NAD(P)-dependent oxidoreductase [Hymenobacter sp. YIM 151500-1]UYZ63553.1 SDR family NAD(P)-dependent oxidoreductase [Hymenobacter sp. YIM 151500-1]